MNSVAAVIEQNQQIIRNECPVVMTHEHGDCCQRARNWLVGMARSFDFSVTDRMNASGPGWLKEHYNWGPSVWPIHWCEAVNLETIDCGLFRVFANEIFAAKGITSFSAQVLRFQQPATTGHWRQKWAGLEDALPWAGQHFVYHEICAVALADDQCGLYDPTDGVWLDPDLTVGHGSHFGVRVESAEMLNWNQVTLGGNQWVSL